MNRPHFLPLVLLSSFSALGCSAQADPHYRGEPVVSVHGTVTTEGAPPSSNIDAAIVWMKTYKTHSAPYFTAKFATERASVSGTFPANFTLDVFTPPPAEAMVDMNGPTGVWIGAVAAVAAGTKSEAVQPSDVVGVDVNHTVFYFDHDLDMTKYPKNGTSEPEGYATIVAKAFRVPPTKGYHLSVADPAPPDAVLAFKRCIAGIPWVCPKDVSDDPVYQAYTDWEYTSCLALHPGAGTCTQYSDLTTAGKWDDAKWAVNQRCMAEMSSVIDAYKGPPCPDSQGHRVDNPAEFGVPVSIVLGSSIWEVPLGQF
jgi:hypothetical protein